MRKPIATWFGKDLNEIKGNFLEGLEFYILANFL